MAEQLRRDPVDGKVYSFAEMSAYYAGQNYNKQKIKAYWNDCVIVTPKAAKAKAETKAQVKAKSFESQGKIYREKQPKAEDTDAVAAGLCVCGEALIDFLPCTSSSGDAAFRGVFGGSPFNCCIAAQRLGIPVTFLGGLSTDLFGERLHSHLESEGVEVSLSARFANPTTLAFVCREEGKPEKYAFFKENAADRSLTKAHVAEAMRKRKFRAVHMSLGAVTLEHQQCGEAFRTFFSMAGKQGALRTFDPNIRANMITESPKKYSKRIEALLRSVDLVKTSDEDAEFLYGADVDIKELAGKWLKLGPKMVVFTKGSKGAVAFVPGPDAELLSQDMQLPEQCGDGKTLDKDGKAVPVCDTVGAGDTFMGGLITGCLGTSDATLIPQLVEKKAWSTSDVELVKEVLKLAVTAAAINCSKNGCDPPTLEDVAKVEPCFKKLLK